MFLNIAYVSPGADIRSQGNVIKLPRPHLVQQRQHLAPVFQVGAAGGSAEHRNWRALAQICEKPLGIIFISAGFMPAGMQA